MNRNPKIHMSASGRTPDSKPACGAKSTKTVTEWAPVTCTTCLGWKGSSFMTHLPPETETSK